MVRVLLPEEGKNSPGMSLVELVLVLLLIGLLFSLGAACWGPLAASRRIARTQADLNRIKHCLVRHAAAGGRYPSYESASDCSRTQDTDLGVCLCREGGRDAWGNAFLFLEGRESGGGGLAGKPVSGFAYQGLEPTDVSEESRAVGRNEETYARVAFVLVSLGANGVPDGDFDSFPPDVAARTMDQPANFSVGGADFDDIYRIVTARELRAAVRE